jgi:hypothetical protein
MGKFVHANTRFGSKVLKQLGRVIMSQTRNHFYVGKIPVYGAC